MVKKRKRAGNRHIKHIKDRVFDRGRGMYRLDNYWPYLAELRHLVLKVAPPSFPHVEKKIARLGRVKLALLTGVFLNIPNTRVDLMVVGDDLDYRRVDGFIKTLESDMGTELRYVILGTAEFKYRWGMFDRFVHDIVEYPHKKVINRVGRLVPSSARI